MTVRDAAAPTACAEAEPRPAVIKWGTNWRQRLRLTPLYLALAAADRLAGAVPARAAPRLPPWRKGLSVVIPERDAPAMLAEALATVRHALAGVDEPHQVIVVANGTPAGAYDDLKAQFPEVEFVHADLPLGFVDAIERGVARARYDWTYLMNNDMTLDVDTLSALLPSRSDDVFAVASQIYQQSADGRREETGFTDWYIDHSGLQLYHAPVRDDAVAPHLCASGGAALFRTAMLRRYLPASRCYHPFYWEDVEWGVRAWRDGLRVLFSPRSRVSHRHRASTARFFSETELGRIVQRNRWLFDARHGVTRNGLDWLMDRICDLPYETQRDFARLPVSVGVFRARLSAQRNPQPLRPPELRSAHGGPAVLRRASYGFRLGEGIAGRPARRRMLLITPFAVFPPRHGGARRVAEIVRALGIEYDVVLITDEAQLYDARSLAHFDGLHAVHLVQRDKDAHARGGEPLADRIRSHCHRALVSAVDIALTEYQPELVQVEHAELAGLIRCKRAGQRWILDLHDAYGPADFDDADAAQRFESEILGGYDAVTVCSDEDRALIRHPRTVSIRNGSSVPLEGYRASKGAQLLFMGPFRYARNLQGILEFARDAFPAIRAAHPAARLLVLGGDGAPDIARRHPVLVQPGIDVVGHRDDVAAALRQCTLTVNPLTGIRGSALKLVESLTAGRVCVGTHESARGFVDAGFGGLVTVPDVAAMAAPIIELLTFDDMRHRLERPQPDLLAPHQWTHCLQPHMHLCAGLVASPQA